MRIDQFDHDSECVVDHVSDSDGASESGHSGMLGSRHSNYCESLGRKYCMILYNVHLHNTKVGYANYSDSSGGSVDDTSCEEEIETSEDEDYDDEYSYC